MCGGGRDQKVTTKTELDPELMRLLYGGSIVDGKRYGFGQAPDPNAPAPVQATSSSMRDGSYGPDVSASTGGFDSFGGGAPSQGGFGGSMSDHVGSGAMYATGGPVQTGIASMQPNMPMTQNMPMMNGMLPNLSDPEIAATLVMAQMRPQMMAGMGSQGMGMPQQGFAMGGMIEGPGTGTSDSIPATIYQDGMPVQDAALSDGEFVMTERAVRGAGNGDREAGAARMYEMMRMFERGGRV
jgi:hypothetical protein